MLVNNEVPVHHIDASVFVELLIEHTKRRKSYAKECRAYLESKIGKNYLGTISLLALGEIVKVIGSIEKENDWETDREREKIFTNLLRVLHEKNAQFWSPQFGCMKKALEIEKEFQYEPADTLHLACASEDPHCTTFVTIEEKFLNNPLLEKKLNRKIKHPSDL